MNDFPVFFHLSEKVGRSSPVVDNPPVLPDGRLDFSIYQCPGELSLDIDLDIAEVEFEPIERIGLGFNMMLNQVRQACVFSTTLEITGTLVIQEMFPEWLSIGI